MEKLWMLRKSSIVGLNVVNQLQMRYLIAYMFTIQIIDAKGMIVAPGFIDIQINGAYGIDFSDPTITKKDIHEVRRKLLSVMDVL